MNTARYVIAVMLLVGWLPGVVLWFLVHPFVRFWRRIGQAWTYVLLSGFLVVSMVGLFLVRGRLLAVEFGTHYALLGAGVLCVTLGLAIAIQRRKHLTFRILAGLPEIFPKKYPPKLLSQGIYGTIRHPRYVEALFWVLGYAFLSNYLASYVLFAVSVPMIYLIVVLEERELLDRFGQEYDDYSRRVPRFFPRLKRSRR